jgi:6-phosphofructokinase 1
MVLELMGRDAGHISLWAGIAGGADVILLPEIPYKLSNICEKLEQLKKRGRNFALVVVAEAVKTESGEAVTAIHGGGAGQTQTYGGIGQYIGTEIARLTGAETRVTVLGHVQRGGTPEPGDRVIASAFGVHAVDLIAEKRFDRMVAWNNRRVIDVPIEDAIRAAQTVDPQGELVTAARGLGISFGDSVS